MHNGPQTIDRLPNVLVIGLSNLDIVWNLSIGIWDFSQYWVIINFEFSLPDTRIP